MPILHDYHMHTKRCGHATGEVHEYVAEAKRKGLEEIGFSDHLPFVTHRDSHYTMDLSELPDYQRDIEEAVAKNRDLSIKVGIEADYMEDHMDQIQELIQSYPYDFVIGSVHFMKQPFDVAQKARSAGDSSSGRWAFDDPREKEKWENADVDMIYRNYYRLLQDSAKSGIFDIIGHVDLVKKFGHRATADLTDLIHQTGKVFKESGLSIEINSSGLRKPVQEIYPSLEVLKIYASYDIPIVFGSDAHAPADVGESSLLTSGIEPARGKPWPHTSCS